MKKNWTMRVALLIVALALITSCFVSGTYAKYVTSGSGSDTARVAKFGVVIESDGNLFADTYKKTANTPGASGDSLTADGADIVLSVISTGATAGDSDEDNVVAPGTKNEDGLTFSVTGTPEVAVAVTFTATSENDIFLKAKTGLPNMTTADAEDTFDLAADYYPVVYTLKQGTTTLKTGTIAEIVEALNGLTATYKANTNLATAIGTLTLTWEWDYGALASDTGHDKQDTLLGDLAAGTTLAPATTLTAGTDYNLTTNISLTISIAQID